MRLNVKEGKTLLIDGPASVGLLSGSVTVLGMDLQTGSRTVVRNGKRIPLEVLRDAEFELTLGDSSSFIEVEGSTIPKSWKIAANTILALDGRTSVLVIGGVDTGKTSICTFLANLAIEKERKVAVIDGDLGQSDIGPPTTVGLAPVERPIVNLYSAKAESIVFVGTTTPSKAFEASLNALKILKDKSTEMAIDFLVINTDGWVEGDEAIRHKSQAVELSAPTAVIAIQERDELRPLLETLHGPGIFVVESPGTVKRRSSETRKALRELAYRRYLNDAKVQSYPLSWVEMKGTTIGTGNTFRLAEQGADEKLLHGSRFHNEESAHRISVEEDKNLIVGLEDEKGEFLGIGISCSIDLERRTIKVYTPVNERAKIIRLGQIRLDKNGKEIV